MAGLGSQSPNQREGLSAKSSISSNNEYVYSTNHALNTTATISGTVTITGTVAATQSGTWNINNVSGTVSLPTGAATAANQTSGGQLTQIVDAGGDAVTVTGGKLDVNATVTGGTGSSAIDDSPFAVGSDSGTPAMGLFDDVAPDSVDEGDAGVLRMSGNRVLYSQIRDAAGNERGVNVSAANALKVDGSAVTQPVSGSGTFTIAGTVTANAGTNLNTSALALESGGNLATISGKLPSALSADRLKVALVSSGGADLSGTLATEATLAKLTISQGTALGSNTVALVGGSVTTNAPTFTTGQINQFSLTTTGGLRVDLKDTASNTNNLNVNLAASAASVAVTNAGTFAVQTTVTAPTTIYNGKKTVTTAGTKVTLAASQAVKSVAIKALSTNTGFIYVGDGSVASTTGLQLLAGETVSLDIANLATVNLDSSVNGEGVTYIATN